MAGWLVGFGGMGRMWHGFFRCFFFKLSSTRSSTPSRFFVALGLREIENTVSSPKNNIKNNINIPS